MRDAQLGLPFILDLSFFVVSTNVRRMSDGRTNTSLVIHQERSGTYVALPLRH